MWDISYWILDGNNCQPPTQPQIFSKEIWKKNENDCSFERIETSDTYSYSKWTETSDAYSYSKWTETSDA